MGERKHTVSTATATAWDGAADPASVSTTLREARLHLGVELRDVAAMLRIRYPYLQAIEDGRYDELPGTAYATGFLRSYAEYLGLDPEAILKRYKDEASGRIGKQQFYLPTPAAEGRIPGGTVLLGTLVLAGIVYGAWYYLSATDRSMADMVPVLPDRLVSLLDNLPWNSGNQTPATAEAPANTATPPSMTVPPPATVAAAPTAPAAGQPAPGGASLSPPPAPPAAQPAPPPAATAPVPPPASPAPAPVATPQPRQPSPAPQATPPAAPQTAALPQPAPQAVPQAAMVPPAPHGEEDEPDMVTQAPTPLSPSAAAPAVPPVPAAQADANGKVYGTQNGTTRIQVRAVQDSWVQIRDAQDIIFTRVLKPGDTYRVPDRPGIRLRTGNAGGLVIVADGVAGQPMGSVGQVLRDVPLDGAPKPVR